MTFSMTGFFAGLLGLLYLALSLSVVSKRRQYGVGLGDGGHKDLAQAIRVHGNFTENVPFALLLMLVVENQHPSVWLVAILGSALVLARILHAVGLGRSPKASPGRFWGTLMTWAVISLGSLLAILPAIGVRL